MDYEDVRKFREKFMTEKTSGEGRDRGTRSIICYVIPIEINEDTEK